MTNNYYNKVKRLIHFLEDNNIELESCGCCCDGIIIDGEGGWCNGPDYSFTLCNSEIRVWLDEHKNEKRDDDN